MRVAVDQLLDRVSSREAVPLDGEGSVEQESGAVGGTVRAVGVVSRVGDSVLLYPVDFVRQGS